MIFYLNHAASRGISHSKKSYAMAMIFPSGYYRRKNNVVELNSKTPRIASVCIDCNTMMSVQLAISPPTVTIPMGNGLRLPEPISSISL